MEASHRSRSPFTTATTACPRCGRASASPFAAVGICLRCAGERVLAGDVPPAPPPAVSVELTLDERASLPPRIGRYEIIEELGRGGMGCVYAARQIDLGRIVALKAIGAGARAAELELRFLREGQTMARLRHPHIVTVHDSGRADGHAFLAMDFIEGGDLARRLRERPLLPREAAALVRKVAAALAYTHREGVLHRDLKPSNILLDGDEPRVADFGLAADLSPGGDLTAVTKLIGTPHYLAPEAMQRGSAALSVASDLYALGVVLFETLAGRTPFAGATPAELPALVANHEPPSLRLLAPAVPRDLETICLQCLERQPERRYPGADALAEDLRRFLAGEPILARPPGRVERFRRFAQRHRAGVTATAAILVVLATATGVSAWQAVRARRAEKRAASEAQASKELIAFLQNDLLAPAGPGVEPDREIKLRTVAERAAKKIEGRFAGRPMAEAAIRDAVAQVFVSLGEFATARIHEERALALRREFLGPDDPETLRTLAELGVTWRTLTDYPRAITAGRQALAGQERVLGPEHVATVRSMTALAGSLTLAAQYAEAEKLYRRAFEVQSRVLGPEHPDTLTTMHDRAYNFDCLGNAAEAEKLYRQTYEARMRVLGEKHPETLSAMANLGIFYTQNNMKPEEARALQDRALELRRVVLGPEHPETIASVNSVAADLLNAGKFAASARLHEENYEVCRRKLGPEHAHTLATLHNLAYARAAEGRIEEAAALFADCLEKRRRVLSPSHPDTLRTASAFAGLLRERGKIAEAVALYEDTVAQRRVALSPEHVETLRSMHALAVTYRAQGRLPEAIALMRETLEIRRRVVGPEDPDTLASLDVLGETLVQTGALAEAEPILRQSLEVRAKKAPTNWRTAAARSQLGEVLLREKRFAEAEPLIVESAEALQRAAPQIPATARAVVARAASRAVQLYTAWGRETEAATWKERLPKP